MKRDRSGPQGMPGTGSPGGQGSGIEFGLVNALGRWLFKALVRRAGSPPIEFALGDGGLLHVPHGQAVGRVTIRDARVVWDLVIHPELAFGDAYSAGQVEITGNLVEVLSHLYRSTESAGHGQIKRSLFGLQPRAGRNSVRRSKHNIHHHYDLGNDFYSLWLDQRMIYTCAYYEHPGATLEQAQVAKLDHVCRKVELRPGMQVIEAGCGWGALALHMAREYGVKVKAFNISSEQVAYARTQARAQGLEHRVEFIEDDYRNISGQFDAFVSVGMLEHVGTEHYAELGRVIARALRSHGRALLHSVGRSRPQPPNAWLERRIFPGSYPPSLREILDILEPCDFKILDLENLRLHYARTLLEWLARFDARGQEIREMYDETFVRAWRLYLAGCAAAFKASSIQLYQVVFTHPQDNAVPMTRAHLYGAREPVLWKEFEEL